MTFKRLIPCAVASAFLAAAVPALAQVGGGAVVTTDEAAPAAVSQTVPDPPEAAPAPDAAPAQTPTTPEGEEQPPAEEPDGEQPPTAEPLPEDGNSPGAEVGGESAGGLPATGWQAFALASIGLGLLLAGAALRPTSSWPPPRDRLSRSPMRR